MSIDLETLNPSQREAVETTEGPLLVLAGAGSGKTRVLTYRIAHMVEDLGVAPWQVLAITFTNKAAREMRERLDRLMDGRSTRGMWVCTFHAMCVRMLRFDGDRLGFTKNFTIYDADDSKSIVKSILQDLGVDEKHYPVNSVKSRISSLKNELVGPDEFMARATTPPEKIAAKAYVQLQERLKRANAMDFDDLLVNAYELLRDNPDVLCQYQERFAYISVDEYQDTNHAQYQICRMLAAGHHNLMVVGDDDQSIYSWRGADIRNILDFEKDYPGAHTVKLEENYRSTGHILEAANAVVAHNSQRKPKRLFTNAGEGQKIRVCLKRDEIAEASYIAGEMKALHDQRVGYEEMAVFYRTNAQSRVLEDGLVKAGIPYRIIGSTRFFDRQEIRDLTAYLKLVVNPADDVSARRIVNKPARGIGATTQDRIAAIAATKGLSFFEAAAVYVVDEPGVNTKTRNGIVQFLQVISEAQSYSGDLADVVEMVAQRSGLMSSLLAEDTEEGRDRVQNLREFFGVVREYVANHQPQEELLSNAEAAALAAAAGGDPVGEGDGLVGEGDPVADDAAGAYAAGGDAVTGGGADAAAVAGDLTLAGFMEWLALRTDLDTAGEGEGSATLMTVHAAKGLEFDTVFVSGMEQGVFPLVRMGAADASLEEEERRLAYVAITRARRRLYLTYAEQRRLYGEATHNSRSVFLDEIPPQHVLNVGVGSEGFGGFGYDRRGSRHGIGGAGHDVAEYGGSLFGNKTRSSGLSREEAVPSRPATFTYDQHKAETTFKVGDNVAHKKFGNGTVVKIEGDKIVVNFASVGTKQLLKGYAPIVKIER